MYSMNWDYEIVLKKKKVQNYEKHWDIPVQNVFENARPSYYTPQGRIQPGCTGCTCNPLVPEYMFIECSMLEAP